MSVFVGGKRVRRGRRGMGMVTRKRGYVEQRRRGYSGRVMGACETKEKVRWHEEEVRGGRLVRKRGEETWGGGTGSKRGEGTWGGV